MSFKNAFKLLLSRFSYVWMILLYVFIMIVILFSLGLTFLVPVVSAFSAAGIGDMINMTLLALFDGASIADTVSGFSAIFVEIRRVINADSRTFINSMLFVVLVATFAYRFIMGLYELPLASTMQGFMSDNAKYSYTARYIAYFGRSVVFSLVKMLVMTAYDILMYMAIFALVRLVGSLSLIFVPFVFMFALILMLALRYSLISGWSPAMIVGGKKIFPALWFSVRSAFVHFGTLFSAFTIVWVIVFAFNILIGIFTFFAGLVVSIPVSIFFINLLNMTVFYGKTGRSYYVDGSVFTPELPKRKVE